MERCNIWILLVGFLRYRPVFWSSKSSIEIFCVYEAANTVTQICVSKSKRLKDKKTTKKQYVFILILYGNVQKKNDICFEMKHAFIVKLIMLFNFLLMYFCSHLNQIIIFLYHPSFD